mmetsp:Transcript_5690/g.22318  ORF Transcript_5690/g.22318 Transcript_5690/m.22318 type:complete len:425 (-) Transcript_5690:104-1378(-)
MRGTLTSGRLRVFRLALLLFLAMLPSKGAVTTTVSRLLGVSGPVYACAPMVQQSELAFRLLCRRYGVNVAWTPMYYSKHFAKADKHGRSYRQTNYDGASPAETGPLIVQFAGDDPDTVLTAAQYVEEHENVAAVDLNFGCPQSIARKGHYGAFLLEEPELCMRIIDKLATNLRKPVTAKIRILPDRQQTLDLALGLARSGASILTVHGRTKEQKKQFCGSADWTRIREIVQHLEQHGMGHVPIIANGGMASFADCQAALDVTGAAGVMSAEALLEDPALFAHAIGSGVPGFGSGLDHLTPIGIARRQLFLADEYMELAREHTPAHPQPDAVIKAHLFKLLHRCLAAPGNEPFRNALGEAKGFEEMRCLVESLSANYEQVEAAGKGHDPGIVARSWYRRHWGDDVDHRNRDARQGAALLSTAMRS